MYKTYAILMYVWSNQHVSVGAVSLSLDYTRDLTVSEFGARYGLRKCTCLSAATDKKGLLI